MEEEWNVRDELYRDACAEMNVHLEYIDRDGGLLKVSSNESFFVVPFYGWPPLNTASANAIAKDKVLTKALLRRAGVHTPRGEHFYVSSKNEWVPQCRLKDEAYAYADTLGYPVMVKPHNHSRGRGARVCRSRSELTAALAAVAELSHIAIVEDVVTGREGRLLCIDDVVQCLYHKEPDPETHIGNPAAGGALVDCTVHDIPTYLTVLAARVHASFGGDLRIFAIDFFDTGDADTVVLEVNAQPFLSTLCAYGHRDVALSMLKRSLTMYFG